MNSTSSYNPGYQFSHLHEIPPEFRTQGNIAYSEISSHPNFFLKKLISQEVVCLLPNDICSIENFRVKDDIDLSSYNKSTITELDSLPSDLREVIYWTQGYYFIPVKNTSNIYFITNQHISLYWKKQSDEIIIEYYE